MRISTVTMFEQSVSSMNRQQGDFLKVGQQIATGRRVVNPSDDPQAASRAVGVSQSRAVAEQFADARISARNALSQSESVLNSVGNAITSGKTLMVQAASDTLSDADRQSVASELRGIYETLIGQANATDGNGSYLFGGYRDDSPPFQRNGDGTVNYVGDANSREQRIDASRRMPVADNGETIFQSVASGAGYLAEAKPDNAGNVTFRGPQVADPADPGYGDTYTITFGGDAANPTYSIEGVAADGTVTAVATDETYTGDQALSFGGIMLSLEGDPVAGDEIRVGQAEQMNTDLFRTFEKALAVLEEPATVPAEKARLRNTLSSVMRELDNSLDNVLTTRASVGARLNELDVVDAVGSNRMLNYDQALSDLIDLDYAQAISDYSLRQVGLQASQKAFVDIKGMSLFDHLR